MSQLLTDILSFVSPKYHRLAHELWHKSLRPPKLEKVTPKKTLTISLTAQKCEQNCSHCNGHYLKSMLSIEMARNFDFSGYHSVLISGGGNKDGSVSIKEHEEFLLSLPPHLKLNIHPGFQPAANLEFLRQKNAVISFDLPASDLVIKNVYNLPYSRNDYQQLFRDYKKLFVTIPHLTLGLGQTDPSEQQNNIEFLQQQQIDKLALLLFRPTPATRLANQPAPEIEACVRLLEMLCQLFPDKLLLGCMRPAGQYRKDFDSLAWLAGNRSFVQPDHSLICALQKSDVEIWLKEQCCAL
jgi:uncharacterized radical SAM superfamily protein